MGRFINGERPRSSPRSQLNNRISPARFDTPTPQTQENGIKKEIETANDDEQPASDDKPKEKKTQRKRRPLRRSRRKLVLMKSYPELKKRIRQKSIALGLPASKPDKRAAKTKNEKKTKK